MASSRARGLLLEGMVIVLSVLVAFGVDAWWDGRQEDEIREALLTGLRSDFALARTDLTRVMSNHDQARAAAGDLITLSLSGGAASSPAALVDSLFVATITVGTFDAPSGTLDAFLASGDLALVEDPDLLLELTAWTGRMTDLEREQATLRAETLELWKMVGEMGVQLFPPSNMVTELPVQVRPSSMQAVVSEPAITQRLWLIWRLLINTRLLQDSLETSLTRIQSLLGEPVP